MPSMIERLYQEGELTIRIKNLKHSYELVRNINKTYMISKEPKPCLICKTPTCNIDICSETHFCSEECENKFYEIYNNILKAEEE